LRAADSAASKAKAEQVGADQEPPLEMSREIVRSFNYRYECKVLVEPQMVVTEVPKVIGTDGQQKMSKSLDNHIELAATPEETQARVMTMVTDPARVRRTDPGNPDVCNVFSFHKIFSSPDEVAMVDTECRRAGIGCVDCKKLMAKNLNASLTGFRARRRELEGHPDDVMDILGQGAHRARAIAEATMAEVRDAVGLP
jgi:tryptophanyl-tRNA synthetase